MKKLIVLGAGGYAQEVLWTIDDINQAAPTWEFLGFLDPQKPHCGQLYDRPVLGGWESLPAETELYFTCAIGSPKARRKECDEAERRGLRAAALLHPSVAIARHVSVGEGTIVGAGSILAPYAVLGRHCALNFNVTIGHDAHVADYCVLSPDARVLGHASLAEEVFVGAGATIYLGRSVGACAIIGANSFVVNDTKPVTSVIGVPALRLATADGGGICTAREASRLKCSNGEEHDAN